ncbi:hypothetical protein CEXT_291671 [Caerostris extrusa]|uniref:Uncharacterized protein n=1 Tax=Caerostris extrusa TaxID=172846 RepID=A0AAV4WV29_CAEEX|nr:hypothetical protein CEXT_291671 [Caerostris extrusa]
MDMSLFLPGDTEDGESLTQWIPCVTVRTRVTTGDEERTSTELSVFIFLRPLQGWARNIWETSEESPSITYSKTSLVNLFPAFVLRWQGVAIARVIIVSREVSSRWPELQCHFTRRSTGRSNLIGCQRGMDWLVLDPLDSRY